MCESTHAQNVDIVFRKDDKNIAVSVSDDGVGFNPQGVNSEPPSALR